MHLYGCSWPFVLVDRFFYVCLVSVFCSSKKSWKEIKQDISSLCYKLLKDKSKATDELSMLIQKHIEKMYIS